MNETPPTDALKNGSSAEPSPADTSGDKRPKGALSERHHKYAEEFKQWMLGLNRHDFGQVRRVLETMTRAYFKHTVKVHSPPMRDEHNDDSGKTSDGIPDSILPSSDPAQ
jgi:hypothetical protein